MALTIGPVFPGESHPAFRNPDLWPHHFARGRAAAARLIREYLEEVGEDLTSQNIDAELAALPGEYASPEGALFVGWHDEEPVAVGGIRATGRPGECEIKRLYVTPKARRDRWGDNMMGMLLDAARERGYERVVLDTLDHLTAANALCRKWNFLEIPNESANPAPGAKFFRRDLGANPPHGSAKGDLVGEGGDPT